jgi:hypothetical protein
MPKVANDMVRAYRGYFNGKETDAGIPLHEKYSPYEAAIRALGASPSRDASTFETGSAYEKKVERKTTEESSGLRNQWVRASGRDRDKIWTKIQDWNKDHLDDAITHGDLRKAERRWKQRRAEALEEID